MPRPTTDQHDRPAELPELPELLDVTALAAHLGVKTRHVRRLVADRRIPYIKWGHYIRFDPGEVAAWIDEFRRHPGRPA